MGYYLPNGLCDWDTECGEVIEYGYADVKFGNLTAKVSCHEMLAEQFDAVHFRFDATSSSVILTSAPADRPSEE